MEPLIKNCRLCGKIINDENFALMDEVIKDILNTLLLKITFSEEFQHLMCSACSEKLFAAYNFKWMCLSINDSITPCLQVSCSVGMRENYVKEEESNVLDDKQTCHLCMQLANNEYFSLQDIETDIVQFYIPEIDFKVTVDPIICKICYDSLFTHSSFIKDCLNVEQRTYKDDWPVMDTDLNDGYIETKEIEIKHEKRDEEEEEKSSKTQFTEIQLKEEFKQEMDLSLPFFGNETNIDNIEHCSSEHLQQMQTSICKREGNDNNLDTYIKHSHEIGNNKKEDFIKYEDPSEVQTYKSRECKFENSSKTQLNKCGECEFETKYEQHFKVHQLRHNDSSEWQMHKCSECEYESRKKSDLKTHQLCHKDIQKLRTYKCGECNYEAKFKKYLIQHQLRHKDSSEVQIYKCGECKYETKYKQKLKMHQLTHKDSSEVQMHKCSECKYETKYKANLGVHQLIHKDPSKVQMYKCSECKYETKYKNSLGYHQTKHHPFLKLHPQKNPSEGKLYICNECKYETEFKRNLIQHQLIHKDPSKVQMFKCTVCSYETKHKGFFSRHVVAHEPTPKIQTSGNLDIVPIISAGDNL